MQSIFFHASISRIPFYDKTGHRWQEITEAMCVEMFDSFSHFNYWNTQEDFAELKMCSSDSSVCTCFPSCCVSSVLCFMVHYLNFFFKRKKYTFSPLKSLPLFSLSVLFYFLDILHVCHLEILQHLSICVYQSFWRCKVYTAPFSSTCTFKWIIFNYTFLCCMYCTSYFTYLFLNKTNV